MKRLFILLVKKRHLLKTWGFKVKRPVKIVIIVSLAKIILNRIKAKNKYKFLNMDMQGFLWLKKT